MDEIDVDAWLLQASWEWPDPAESGGMLKRTGPLYVGGPLSLLIEVDFRSLAQVVRSNRETMLTMWHVFNSPTHAWTILWHLTAETAGENSRVSGDARISPDLTTDATHLAMRVGCSKTLVVMGDVFRRVRHQAASLL